ncbi:Tubulin-tyrosine ligase family protein [Entamoeba marina]
MEDISQSFMTFLQSHQQQLKRLNIPKNLYVLLEHKLNHDIFDAGQYFQFCVLPEGILVDNGRKQPYGLLCSKEDGIKANSNVFLIEHHFVAEQEESMMAVAKQQEMLYEYEEIFGLDSTLKPAERLQNFYDTMWEYNASLRLRDKETNADTCLWYLLDNVGNSVIFQNDPNCMIVPFFYLPKEIFYTLLIPIKDIDYAEVISSSFLNPLQLLPDDFCCIPLRNRFVDAREVTNNLKNFVPEVKEPLSKLSSSFTIQQQPYSQPPTRIFSQMELIKKHLKCEPFVCHDDINTSDAMFLSDYLVDEKFAIMKGTHAWIDQFEGQYALTIKPQLTKTIKNVYGENFTTMLSQTFDFSKELDCKEFVSTYFKNEDDNKDNYWIINPTNYTQGKGISITNNINMIIKIANSIPCICSRYNTSPLLFNNKKFDMRFIVMMKYDCSWNSSKPDVYLYDTFWPYFAKNDFTLNDLLDYEAHFTRLHASEDSSINDTDFIKQFNTMYEGKCNWDEMKHKIELLLANIFDSVVKSGEYKFETNSCAIYGVDIEINSNFTPSLLELKFQPDCGKACEQDSEFYNNIFTTLFKELKCSKQIY